MDNTEWAESKIIEANGNRAALETLARKLATRADLFTARKNGKSRTLADVMAWAYDLPTSDPEVSISDLMITIDDIGSRMFLVIHYIKCNEPLEGIDSFEELLDTMKEMSAAASALESLLIAREVDA